MTRPDPIYLTTVREILGAMKISEGTMQEWIKQGAPIGVEVKPSGKRRYRTEKHALMAWLMYVKMKAPEQAKERLDGKRSQGSEARVVAGPGFGSAVEVAEGAH